jgi:hypothetical protein
MALIEDTIPLPALLQLRSKSYLEALYTGKHLSVREIANLTDLSHSVVCTVPRSAPANMIGC